MKRPRRLAALVAIAATTLAACGGGEAANSPGSTSLDGQQLVFVNYGGASLDAAKAGWLEPFAQQTGAQFATDGPSDVAKVKAMVESGNTTWDLIDIDPALGGANCGTVFERRPASVDISRIAPEYVTDDCGIPIMVTTNALVYNTRLFGANPPTSLNDFFNTAQFPGKRMIFNSPTGWAEMMLAADGVAESEMYPIDFDRLQRLVQGLGPDMSVQPTLATMNAALEEGDFAMCICITGRTVMAAQNGAPVEIVWDKIHSAWDDVYAVKGSRFPEAQTQFLQFLTTPKSLGFYERLPYGPTLAGTVPNLPPELAEALPANHQDQIKDHHLFNVPYWSQNADTAYAEWNRILAG